MNKTTLGIAGVVLIVAVLAAVQLFYPRAAVSPVLPAATSTPEQSVNTQTTSVNTTATVSITNRPSAPLQIAAGDNIASWDFNGVYKNNPELVAKAEAEIKRLTGLIGSGTYPDMTIYVAIANQYELLGDGKREYDYLGRAIATSGAVSGLPWHNLGALMERLGALETARTAYEKSTLVQPLLKQWHYAYLEFLVTRTKADATNIEKAFAASTANIGKDADMLQLYSEWKNS